MILTVTLNAALDVTYRVEALVPHTTHRVAEVSERAGGKGLNVARVLHGLGEPVLATGLLGGDTGARVRRLLGEAGLGEAFVPIGDETRRTVAVVDGDATGFWEPGPVVTPGEWDAFRARYASLLGDATVVVLSGSLPRGLPADAYATLIAAAREAGARTVLDTSGAPLSAALPARPDVVKPNLHELRELLADAPADGRGAAGELVRLAGAVRALGAGAVVASAGADGLVGVTADGVWRVRPPERVAGNPTGAGDASVAALARGLRDRSPWPRILTDAVALSAAAVAAPVAGTVEAATADRFRTSVTVTEITQEFPAC
ncbi:1-phosphofructokinase family hexose kinase [Cryptosporangium japonicum]|uniref:1-phosphofructokinase family hexose kinase n=1 Tax=Cryptosporangium japonicum TaxID=80872 RepID=A0ABP3DHH9_9ACTN